MVHDCFVQSLQTAILVHNATAKCTTSLLQQLSNLNIEEDFKWSPHQPEVDDVPFPAILQISVQNHVAVSRVEHSMGFLRKFL